MCDLAYALLVEQIEGDARAAVARGTDIEPVQFFRDALDEWLTGDDVQQRDLSPEQRELREVLGV